MSHVAVTSQPRLVSVSCDTSRVSVRYPCEDGRWKVLRATDPEHSPVAVMNISTHDLFLDANRPFRPGELLSVELREPDDEPAGAPLRKLVRVAEVEPDDNGRWLHLCLFIIPLGPKELR